jgi:DNA-binding NtrC family response regulator
MNPMILVVDDEESIRKLLRVRLTREGYSVQEAENGKEALKKVEIYDPLAVVSDIRMPEMDGFEFLDELSKQDNAPSVVLITGHGEKECAIQAVRTGAYDYIEKPFDLDQVMATVARAVEATVLKRQNVDLMSKLERKNKTLSNTLVQRETELKQLGIDVDEASNGGLIGESEGIKEVKTLINRITPEGAKSEDDCSTVLITGESGTGKEVAAKMIHDCSASYWSK